MSFLLPLLILCALSVVLCDEPGTLTTTVETFHKDFYELNHTGPCASIAEKYLTVKFNDLPQDARDEIMHCYYREAWIAEKKNQEGLYKRNYNTTCDIMMIESDQWSTLDQIDKSFVNDCQANWARVAITKKHIPELAWLPNTVLDDVYLPYIIAHDIMKCFLINRQFKEDRRVNLAKFKSDNQQKGWEVMGINVAHYKDPLIVDDESLENFRSASSIEDYIRWNSVESCIACDSILTIALNSDIFKEMVDHSIVWLYSVKDKINLFNQ